MEKGKITMEEIIKEVEKEVMLFCSTTGQAYLKGSGKNGDVRLILIESDDFEQWLRAYCYDKYDMILSSGGHVQAQAHLKMKAIQSKKRIKFHRRVYAKSNAIYYDLGRRDGKVLKITADEIGKVRASNIYFVRSNIFEKQVEPEIENISAKDVKKFVKKHFNLRSECDQILLSVFLVSCFFTDLSTKPILQVYGQKASAKSTCLRRIQDLIDPHTVNPLFSMPRKENEVAMCLSAERMVCFDNISFISPAISDLLCRCCTGTAQIKRKLFTDNSQSITEPDAVVCINSIRQCIMKSDLADRAIFLELERIAPEKMQGDRELQEKWRNDLPLFLGAICLTVQGILGDNEPIKMASPARAIDFYELSVKVGRQMGYSEEKVHKAFCMNKKRVNEAIVWGNILLTVLDSFMSLEENKDGIKAKVSDFYKELKLYAIEEWGVDKRNFPGAPESMTRKMGNDRSNLEKLGIYFNVKKGTDARYIEIWRQ